MTPGGPAAWVAVGASRRGSNHVRRGVENQDAFSVAVSGEVRVAALADGHGDPAHFRSAVGAHMAAELVTALAGTVDAELADRPGGSGPGALRSSLERHVRGGLLTAWRDEVRRHVASHPFTADEQSRLASGSQEPALRAYGTTVVVVVATPYALGLVQLGDGDIVLAYGDGEPVRPLPPDRRLDGLRTTSLYQDDAARSMRIEALGLVEREVAIVFAATDGFGGSQVDAVGWWRQVGAELADRLARYGPEWIVERLPGWLVEPAEVGGDDTTMVVLMNTAWRQAPVRR